MNLGCSSARFEPLANRLESTILSLLVFRGDEVA